MIYSAVHVKHPIHDFIKVLVDLPSLHQGHVSETHGRAKREALDFVRICPQPFSKPACVRQLRPPTHRHNGRL